MLTVVEVANALRVSKRVAYGLWKRGELPGRKVGKALRFRQDDVAIYIAANGAPMLAPEGA